MRFDLNDRWTYKLQQLLGDSYDVVEEGLRSRTTDVEDPEKLDRNGLPYLRACLETHEPVTFLVYMLGTNDTKRQLNRSVEEISASVSRSIKRCHEYIESKNQQTKIILMAPPRLSLNFLPPDSEFDSSSDEKIYSLKKEFKKIAKEYNLIFLDLSDLRGSENDGIHMTPKDNNEIANRLVDLIL